MNILNLATSDENAAGVAARNVNEMFLQAGHKSVLLVKESGSIKPNVIAFKQRPTSEALLTTLYNKVKNKAWQYYKKINPLNKDEKYSFHNLNERRKHFSGKEILDKVQFKPDVILVFWVSDFVNSKTIRELSEAADCKIILLMTDNAPITGGCHYPWNCEGFHSDCSGCPALLDTNKKKIAQKNLAFKKENLPGNVELIAGSESDYQRALKASLFKGRKIHKLVAPIDEHKFYPGNKVAAKQHFGVNATQKVIFFGATSLNDPRKGVQYFLEALYKLKEKLKFQDVIDENDGYLILLAGKEGFEPFRNIGIPVKEVGYLNAEDLIKAYQAADFAISPSLEDSGPMMVNQCIMCGTPMVTFNTGVAMDLVKTGETGYISRLFDADDLAEGMKYMLLLNEQEREKISLACRNFALKTITYNVYIRELTSLF